MSHRWHVPTPQPTRCHHECDDDREICTTCALHLADLLADIPALNQELDTAITKQTAFVERGQRRTDEKGDNDEAPVLFNIGASKARQSLEKAVKQLPRTWRGDIEFQTATGAARAILNDYKALLAQEGVNNYLHTLSKAATRAHNAIDRPRDMTYLGECPQGHALDGERNQQVTCHAAECDYTATYDDHIKNSVNGGDDRWLTVKELVGAFTKAGEPVKRETLNTWIRREGIPREVRTYPQFVNGQLKVKEVSVYRLGDIRELIQSKG